MPISDVIREQIEAHNKLSPVDKALSYVEQRQSFVRGMVWHEPDFSDDPASILAKEVRRLRCLVTQNERETEAKHG